MTEIIIKDNGKLIGELKGECAVGYSIASRGEGSTHIQAFTVGKFSRGLLVAELAEFANNVLKAHVENGIDLKIVQSAFKEALDIVMED